MILSPYDTYNTPHRRSPFWLHSGPGKTCSYAGSQTL
ncbi:uncharacterized protein METZ01_LOCUS345789, partial [marine metagenome]